MRTVVLIPTRMASKRFPGKPLFQIRSPKGKKTVIEHCFGWVWSAGYETYVVSGDQEILDLFPDNAIRTFLDCRNGTERCFEAARSLRLSPEDVVINVQGDVVSGSSIVLMSLVGRLRQRKEDVMTVVSSLSSEQYHDSNTVKAVVNSRSRGIFFSRLPLLSCPDVRAHVGIYGMSMRALSLYVSLGQCSWEQAESLEQMRWLYCGYHMGVYMDTQESYSINTLADVKRVEEKWMKIL